jgi:O-antigen biosynthesis protein
MNLKSLYFYMEYASIQFGRRAFFFLFGIKGEKFFTKTLLRFFDLKNKFFLHQSNGKRLINDLGADSSFFRGKEIRQTNITIIVPVFNAYEELKNCLESLIHKTQPPYRLLLIDDASTDVRIRPLLQQYESTYPYVITIFNNKNLGYTATINKGCVRAGPDDVVLLNSDTQVTQNWLKKMSDCAKSDPRVASVTPLSNAAGVFSVPLKDFNNQLPEFMSIDEMGDLVERLSLKKRPVVPTGHGFCMYVTRRALDDVGLFDETRFPQGYGEENDFCVRAGKRGFIHLIDDSTFIYHKRTSSYKDDKKIIISKSMRTLNVLHPEYKFMVLKWLASDPLDEFRALLQKELGKCRVYENNS